MRERQRVAVTCRVNGAEVTIEGHPLMRLLDALRVELRLTGTKEGCGEGECGACAVLIDGELVNSCLVPLLQAEGGEIRTIEGVAGQNVLHEVQQAFIAHGGAQCGICTPGMVLAAVNLLERSPRPASGKDYRESILFHGPKIEVTRHANDCSPHFQGVE